LDDTVSCNHSIDHGGPSSLVPYFTAIGRCPRKIPTSTSGGPGGALAYTYDAFGRQTKVTDANGGERETFYDNLGRVERVENEMDQPVIYHYDTAGRRDELKDAKGNITKYAYDDANRLETMTYPDLDPEDDTDDNVESYEYYASGLLQTKTTPNNDIITYGYNDAGKLLTVSFGETIVAYGRDLAGAVTSIGGAGDITAIGYTYDELGRMKSSSDSALVKTITYTSDLRGLRTGLLFDGTTVTYTYDNAGRLDTVQKSSETIPADYGYDNAGRRDSLTLPNGVSTSYGYTTSDQLKSLTTTGPGGTLASFTYTLDDTDNRDGITYADGSTSTYDYDEAYRLTEEVRSKAGGTGVAYTITYEYDDVGNRTRMTSTNSAKPYRAESDTGGLWHMDEPVEAGAITVVDASGSENDLVGGSGIESVEGRLGKAVYFDGTGGPLSCEDDAALELGSGDFTLELWVMPESITGTSVLASKWDEATDARSWRLSLVAGVPAFDLSTDGTSSTVNTLTGTGAIAVDEWAQIVATRSAGTVKLSVDGVQVATMTDPGAVYDGAADVVVGAGLTGAVDELRLSSSDRVAAATVGNTETNYRYNARNQLAVEYAGPTLTAPALPTDASVKTYSYDKNGNVLTIVETVDTVGVSSETMVYDKLNRMTSHTGPKGTESFTYRGAEWHRASANGKQFLYDGDNVLADISGDTTNAFYVTPSLDQNLSITNVLGTYYYSQDGVGSVRTLTDSTGTVVDTYDYLPFGKPRSKTMISGWMQRYGFTGREGAYSGSGLVYFRYRTYSTDLGRFLQRDPNESPSGGGKAENASLAGPLYDYAGQSPTFYHDPMGLAYTPVTIVPHAASDQWIPGLTGGSSVQKIALGFTHDPKSTFSGTGKVVKYENNTCCCCRVVSINVAVTCHYYWRDRPYMGAPGQIFTKAKQNAIKAHEVGHCQCAWNAGKKAYDTNAALLKKDCGPSVWNVCNAKPKKKCDKATVGKYLNKTFKPGFK
jgi:RHS repeat-associated protein